MKKSLLLAALLTLGAVGSASAQMSPDVSRSLIKARGFLAAHRFREAEVAVNAAAARANTENEKFIVEEMRASIASASGDKALAQRVYAQLLASGRVPASEQLKLLQAEFSMAYADKRYPDAISWLQKYFKAGGNAPEMHAYLIRTYYDAKDFGEAARLQTAEIANATRARLRPTESQLTTLASCQENLHDSAGFQNTMALLVTYYPKPDYWANLLHNVQVDPNFSSRLTLDLDRLKMALGLVTSPDDLMEMAELALQGPLPGEAKAIIDKAYADGILGTGPGAARQQRLRDLVNKTYASELPQLPKREAAAADNHDGNPLVSLGEEYVSYGQFDKGIPMIEAGIAKGDLRHPEDTKLHLGLAYYHAGKKAQAIKVLKTVAGKDGTAGLARLWVLYIGRA